MIDWWRSSRSLRRFVWIKRQRNILNFHLDAHWRFLFSNFFYVICFRCGSIALRQMVSFCVSEHFLAKRYTTHTVASGRCLHIECKYIKPMVQSLKPLHGHLRPKRSKSLSQKFHTARKPDTFTKPYTARKRYTASCSNRTRPASSAAPPSQLSAAPAIPRASTPRQTPRQ